MDLNSSNYCTNCQKVHTGIEHEQWFCSEICRDNYGIDIRSIRFKKSEHLPISPREQEYYEYYKRKSMMYSTSLSDCDIVLN